MNKIAIPAFAGLCFASALCAQPPPAVPNTAEFNAGAALVEVGDSYWIGSFRGNRIAILPAR